MKKGLLSIMLMALAIAIPTKTWAQNFIQFEDDVVKSICVANWDTNGDGELSFDEAAAVTDIGKVFKQQYFTRFNELEYFTNLTAIPDSAFCLCSLLEEIRLPQGITSIGNTAFAYNDSLRFVELRDGLESIGQDAFSYCESLFEIYIPSTVTSIGASAFSRCQNVEYVFVDERNTVYDSRNDCNAIIETATNTLIFGFKSSQIPESVVTIGNIAFWGCQFQTVPTFPSSLRSIGEDAFYDCQGLIRLVLPEGLESIYSYAFRSCDIEELTLPSTLTTIGQGCFEFNSLHSLKIPISLTSIGMGAFSNNTELSEIIVEEGNPVFSSPNNCNAIYETSRGRIQQGCNTTVFPEGTRILGWASFEGMKHITTMIIPEGVVDLGDYTFYYCDGIRELSIPSTVGRDGFGEVTFEDCTGLEIIRCYIKQPSALPSKYSGPFGCNRDRYYIYEHATLYVPYGTKALYESTDGWNRFKNIVEMEKRQSDQEIEARKSALLEELDKIKAMLAYAEDMLARKDPNRQADDLWERCMMLEAETKDVEYRVMEAETLDELDVCTEEIDKLRAMLDELMYRIEEYSAVTARFDGLTAWVSGDVPLDEAFMETGGREAAAQTIAAIVWENSYPLTADMLQGISNPNLLVYVTDASLAPEGVQNVVVNGQAQEIILTDATTGNNNFYCPEPFRAQRISYTRNFQQHTVIGTSRGWEGLTLPFPVQTITHATQGQITPFRNDGSNKHFWLRQMRDNGLTYAQTIEPNVPYLIAMPNSTEYYDEFNLSGRVTFSAENTEVYSSENKQQVGTNEIILIPTFTRVAASDDVYALNVGNARDGYAEGSVFIRNSREVRPFEVYTNHMRVGGARPRFIPVNATTNNETVGIKDIEHSTMNNEQWYSVDGRQLQGEPKTKGVYIHKGKKIIK